MKLNKDFIPHRDGNESMLVPTGAAGFSGIIRGNTSFGDIIDCLTKETTRQAVINAMLEKYDAPEDKIAADVDKVLENLRKVGALDE